MDLRYRVDLNQEERDQLTTILGGGTHAARKLKRTQILLAADAGETDEAIAANVSVGISTVYRTRRRFALGNLETALSEAPRPGAERKLSGKPQALLVATACSKPPAGRKGWTLELLADEMVRLTGHEALSRETARRCLAENELKPATLWRIGTILPIPDRRPIKVPAVFAPNFSALTSRRPICLSDYHATDPPGSGRSP